MVSCAKFVQYDAAKRIFKVNKNNSHVLLTLLFFFQFSDECAEDEEQSQGNSIENNKITQVQAMPALNYVASNYIKHELDSHMDSGTEYSHLSSKGPGHSRNSLTMVQSPACARDPACPNNNNELDKYQVNIFVTLIVHILVCRNKI